MSAGNRRGRVGAASSELFVGAGTCEEVDKIRGRSARSRTVPGRTRARAWPTRTEVESSKRGPRDRARPQLWGQPTISRLSVRPADVRQTAARQDRKSGNVGAPKTSTDRVLE